MNVTDHAADREGMYRRLHRLNIQIMQAAARGDVRRRRGLARERCRVQACLARAAAA